MSIQLNRKLDDSLLFQVLDRLFCNSPVTIIKAIARTGKYAQSVPWVWLRHEISGQTWATFISLDDLLQGFFDWLDTVELMMLALFQKNAIAEIIYAVIKEGDRTYSRKLGSVTVIEKERSVFVGLPRVWVETEDAIAVVDAIDLIPESF